MLHFKHRWPVAAVSQGLKPSTALDKAGSNFQLRFIAPSPPKASPSHSQRIKRTLHALAVPVQHMRINHGGAHIAVLARIVFCLAHPDTLLNRPPNTVPDACPERLRYTALRGLQTSDQRVP